MANELIAILAAAYVLISVRAAVAAFCQPVGDITASKLLLRLELFKNLANSLEFILLDMAVKALALASASSSDNPCPIIE